MTCKCVIDTISRPVLNTEIYILLGGCLAYQRRCNSYAPYLLFLPATLPDTCYFYMLYTLPDRGHPRVSSEVPKSRSSQVPKFLELQAPKFPELQVPKFPELQFKITSYRCRPYSAHHPHHISPSSGGSPGPV